MKAEWSGGICAFVFPVLVEGVLDTRDVFRYFLIETEAIIESDYEALSSPY